MKKIISLILIVIGIGLIVIQPFNVTGAVIDLSSYKAQGSFFIGLFSLIIGLVLFLILETIELRKVVKKKKN